MRCSSCGGPMGECADSERAWYPQRTVCYKAMDRAAASAKYDRLHEKAPYHDGTFEDWAKDRSASYPYHYLDGVTIWLHDVDLAPNDQFLGASAPSDPDDDSEVT